MIEDFTRPIRLSCPSSHLLQDIFPRTHDVACLGTVQHQSIQRNEIMSGTDKCVILIDVDDLILSLIEWSGIGTPARPVSDLLYVQTDDVTAEDCDGSDAVTSAGRDVPPAPISSAGPPQSMLQL